MSTKTSQNRKSVCGGSRQAAWGVLAVLLLAVAVLTGCRGGLARGQTMNLTSTSFQDGSFIPAKCTCSGAGVSPQLAWSAPPAGRRALR